MNDTFIQRTSEIWKVSNGEVERLIDLPRKTTVRINPFKVRKSTVANLKKIYSDIEKLSWLDNAYSFDSTHMRPSMLPEFSSGEIIIQNPASFIPVLELEPEQNEKIIDICAAPGGKSSHIAALTNNKAVLVLNDTSRTRFFKMKKLMQTMGVHAEYSLRDGRFLAKEYGTASFDKILLDAPCSGEANLTTEKLKFWNMATIKRLHSLQSKLLQEAFMLLRPGGRLVYSTCTIAPEENEQVVDTLLKHQPSADIIQTNQYPLAYISGISNWKDKVYDARLTKTMRLLPTELCKPFFIAVITKTTNEEDDSYQRLKHYYNS